jgi:hypothetical protein
LLFEPINIKLLTFKFMEQFVGKILNCQQHIVIYDTRLIEFFGYHCIAVISFIAFLDILSYLLEFFCFVKGQKHGEDIEAREQYLFIIRVLQ